MARNKMSRMTVVVLATVCYFLPLIIALPIKGLPPNPIEGIAIFAGSWVVVGLPLLWYSCERSD